MEYDVGNNTMKSIYSVVAGIHNTFLSNAILFRSHAITIRSNAILYCSHAVIFGARIYFSENEMNFLSTSDKRFQARGRVFCVIYKWNIQYNVHQL